MPTITIDGQDHEVELDKIQFGDGVKVLTDEEINKSYVPRTFIEGDDAQYVHKKSFEKRFSNWVPKDKAVEDENIVSAILKKHGEAYKAENLEDAKAQWDEAEAKPLRSQIEELTQNLTTFESQVVGSAIDAAAKSVWQDAFATAPEGRKSWARVNFDDEFTYDQDHGYVVAVNPKGEPIPATNPTQKRPYMGVEERMKQLADRDEYKPFARPAERITTGDGANPKGGEGKGSKRRGEMSSKEKSAYVAEHGKDAYLALPL